jgi:drug/metabolite transporter (DMT)-like permease
MGPAPSVLRRDGGAAKGVLSAVSPRSRAVLLAVLVTFLWSSSWVLIKRGLVGIPPLTFAGLRYSVAFLVLLPIAWGRRAEVCALRSRDWARLAALGLVFYALTQGGQFLTLARLDAITFSLILSATPILVALGGIGTLGERPRVSQWLGIFVAFAGGVLYLLPSAGWTLDGVGLALAGLTLSANAGAALLGRSINRGLTASPVVVTTISMGVGALCLLAAGVAIDGVPRLSVGSWGIILWLAVVNTALAFSLWNLALRTLSATEASVVNNTMLIQIALLAWFFLGERVQPIQIAGLAGAVVGTLLVQLRRAPGAERGLRPR